MREKFVNGFMTKLYGEIPEEYLETIRNKLALHVNDFGACQYKYNNNIRQSSG